jgi:methylphosphotriester-DNA--protein-cysteine methyltransferase
MSATKRYRLVARDGSEVLSATPGTLGGHRRTRVYGRLDCPVALSLIARGYDVRRHRVFFADEATAIAAGYRPCGACLRDLYRSWKQSPEKFTAERQLRAAGTS